MTCIVPTHTPLDPDDIDYESLIGFEEISMSLTGRTDLAIRELERMIFDRPRFRRHIGPHLAKSFISCAKLIKVKDFLEIGVMNGRHTEVILNADPDWTVHSFEPNLYCFPTLINLLVNDRLKLLPFAVTGNSGFSWLNLPLNYLGKQLNPMSGISSLHTLNDDSAKLNSMSPQMVPTISGNDYFNHNSYIKAERTCLWIDTEGNSHEVLVGFGNFLSLIPLIILEVEYGRIFSSSPNWNFIYDKLINSGFDIVGRDWQTPGACNVLAVNKKILSEDIIKGSISQYLDFVSQSKFI